MTQQDASFVIQILEDKKNEIQRECDAQIAELEANISRLRGGLAETSFGISRSHPAVRPGQFHGMKRRAALQAYLNERPGGVLVTKASADLIAGGMPMGKDPRRFRRYVRVTITQNPTIFKYDESSDTVSLRQEAASQPRKKIS